MGRLKKKDGITLIALVVTIIILLILAGVALNLVAGENGILKRATNAVDKHNEESAKEQVELLIAENHMEFYDKKYVDKTYNGTRKQHVLDLLEKGATTDDYYAKASEDGTVLVHEGSDDSGKVVAKGTIREDGSIQWESLEGNIIVNNIKITLEDGTEPENYSQEIGTKLIVKFDASIENGKITNIDPTLPYTTTGNEMEKEFTITGEADGKKYSKTITVNLNHKYVLKAPEITPSATDWTNQDVTITVNYGNADATYKKEISIDGGENYNTYTGPVKIEKNTVVKARIVGATELESELKINWIDKTAPNEFTPTVTENVSATGLTINAKTTDDDSGIKGYQYFVYQGNNLIDQSEVIGETNWIASGLTVGQNYRIYIEAYDKAGNKKSEEIANYEKLDVYTWEKFKAVDASYYSYTETTGINMNIRTGQKYPTVGSLDASTGRWNATSYYGVPEYRATAVYYWIINSSSTSVEGWKRKERNYNLLSR